MHVPNPSPLACFSMTGKLTPNLRAYVSNRVKTCRRNQQVPPSCLFLCGWIRANCGVCRLGSQQAVFLIAKDGTQVQSWTSELWATCGQRWISREALNVFRESNLAANSRRCGPTNKAAVGRDNDSRTRQGDQRRSLLLHVPTPHPSRHNGPSWASPPWAAACR
ncbi:hypothetical protein BC835DRAFT_896637 [Cytidiella melzeri]|nr:hypothetical protein BC835DRAFT_896637 [Cytidiella melzeri]